MMKTIVVDCYLSHNLGDDLFLMTMLARYPHVRFTVTADDSYGYLKKIFSNVELVSPPARCSNPIGRIVGHLTEERRRIRFIRSADAMVTIGGSLYMEADRSKSLKTKINERRRFARDWIQARAAKHYCVIGANFGPWHTDSYWNFYRDFFANKCEDVCFRDTYSVGLFPDIPGVRQAPDVLFGAMLPQVPKRRQAFFSVVDLGADKFGALNAKVEAYDHMMIGLIRRYIARGYEPVLCSFSQPEGDEVGLERLAQSARSQGLKVRTLRYRDNMDEVLHEISASEVMVGTRFHAVILGLSAGAAVLPVVYSAKTTHVLEDIGFDKDHVIDLKNCGWEGMPIEAMPEAAYLDVSRQQAGAVAQFAVLDRLVGGE